MIFDNSRSSRCACWMISAEIGTEILVSPADTVIGWARLAPVASSSAVLHRDRFRPASGGLSTCTLLSGVGRPGVTSDSGTRLLVSPTPQPGSGSQLVPGGRGTSAPTSRISWPGVVNNFRTNLPASSGSWLTASGEQLGKRTDVI